MEKSSSFYLNKIFIGQIQTKMYTHILNTFTKYVVLFLRFCSLYSNAFLEFDWMPQTISALSKQLFQYLTIKYIEKYLCIHFYSLSIFSSYVHKTFRKMFQETSWFPDFRINHRFTTALNIVWNKLIFYYLLFQIKKKLLIFCWKVIYI